MIAQRALLVVVGAFLIALGLAVRHNWHRSGDWWEAYREGQWPGPFYPLLGSQGMGALSIVVGVAFVLGATT